MSPYSPLFAHSSFSCLPFHSTSRPFIRSLIIRQRASKSATFTGFSPTTRRDESPRPIPITMRPFEMSCAVAYQLAVIVGSRIPGFVTKWPSLIRSVRSAASGRPHRSEEHTSELQSHSDLVCPLLLEKKKKTQLRDIEKHQDNCRDYDANK